MSHEYEVQGSLHVFSAGQSIGLPEQDIIWQTAYAFGINQISNTQFQLLAGRTYFLEADIYPTSLSGNQTYRWVNAANITIDLLASPKPGSSYQSVVGLIRPLIDTLVKLRFSATAINTLGTNSVLSIRIV